MASISEYGSVFVGQDWFEVSLTNTYSNPVVVAFVKLGSAANPVSADDLDANDFLLT